MPIGRLRKITVSNNTLNISLPSEIFGPEVGNQFRQTVIVNNDGSYTINLVPEK